MKTVDGKTSRDKALHLEVGEFVVVGVDVHKKNWHLAVWSMKRGLVTHWVQPASAATLIERLDPVRTHISWIGYEAGPTGFGLARALKAAHLNVWVVAPSRVPKLPGRENKTDRLDCIKLAKLIAEKQIVHPVCIPSEQEEADRHVLRMRATVSRKLGKVKVQIKSFLLLHGIAEPEGLRGWSRRSLQALREVPMNTELRMCLDALLEELNEHAVRLRKLNAGVRALARTERHQSTVTNLCTVPGVGLLTAMTVRTEWIQPERFTDSAQVARLIGLAPSIRQSGQSSRSGPIIKSGNARVRWVLVESAWRSLRLDSTANDRYHRLLRNTANPKKAIVGVARQRATCLWRMIVTGKPYRVAPK